MKRRGFMLILSLLLLIILLVLGLGMMGKKVAQYRGAIQVGPATQALAIAESGLTDVLTKLNKDPDFPPAGDQTQSIYTYTENFLDLDGATVLGSYTIVLDCSLMTDPAGTNPYGIYRIYSTGVFGASDRPLAQRRLYAELDAAPWLRSDPSLPNPNHFKLVNFQDLGGP